MGGARDNGMRSMIPFPGARWWKVDFHTHSPASCDYGRSSADRAALRATSPAEWLLGFMQAEIDAVVVTDHNSGAWIDPLRQALQSLEQERPAGYRSLTLFPGIEITASGGAHVLGIFPPSSDGAAVTELLGAVGAQAAPGQSDRAATKSPIEVVRAIVEAGAIPILAHVDTENSALAAPGNTMEALFDAQGLDAMEVCQHGWTPPAPYRQRRLAWARVLGSDSHHPAGKLGQRYPGSHFTWVKMETPSHDGLRLALLDGDEVSIRRSDVVSDDQNQHSHLVIESLTVSKALYCGQGTPLSAAFSPWLTTIIGGRGAGKSTLVEFLRLALRRESDLPEQLKEDFDSFNAVPAGRGAKGALTQATEVEVILQKDHRRYRIRWSTSGSLPAIEEDEGGSWRAAAGEVSSRFPTRIFSQGQIFEMARDARALLKIIDEAPEVGRAQWKAAWDREEHRFLSLRAKVRELEKQLAERPALEGTLSDVCQRLAVFEETAHADVLKAYQRSQRQAREIEQWSAGLGEIEGVLRRTAEQIAPVEMDASAFDPQVTAERSILDRMAAGREAAVAMAKRTSALADQARDQAAAWPRLLRESAWANDVERVGDRYRELVADLASRGVTDVSQYGQLVQQRRVHEERLRALGDLVSTIDGVHEETASSLRELLELRRRLTASRIEFLSNVLHDNRHVRMRIVPYGSEARGAEMSLREVLGLRDGKFADDILSENGGRGCLADIYTGLPRDPFQRETEVERRIEGCKTRLMDLAKGVDDKAGGWFKKHLRQLPPESLDRLQYWFPPDELTVSYSPRGDGSQFRSLEQGSPGQKTAAILAFLLAHGTEPIVLDQPEDDLDNELIYELIVAQLRANKRRRQVIVVTHNPNIVVNGDSELILVMENAGGQCHLNRQGSLQSREIRGQVCTIMEGGREALEKRYRRIVAGDGNV